MAFIGRRQASLAWSIIVGIAMLGSGCSDSDVCSSAPETASAILGSGYPAFRAFTPNQVIPIVAGPQGGYHILADIRVDGLQTASSSVASDPLVSTTIKVDDVSIAGYSQLKRAFFSEEEAASYLVQEPIIFFSTEVPPARQDAVLTTTIKDQCDRSASGVVAITLTFEDL